MSQVDKTFGITKKNQMDQVKQAKAKSQLVDDD